jgi:hypothetical protein
MRKATLAINQLKEKIRYSIPFGVFFESFWSAYVKPLFIFEEETWAVVYGKN